MSRKLCLLVAFLAVASAIAAWGLPLRSRPAGSAAVEGPATNAADGGEFIVHEWGTFTNFAGSDGIQLDFRTQLNAGLPGFVIDYGSFSQSAEINVSLTKDATVAFQRMETPVTYFYSDRVREVSVRVDFPQGLLTEFYPTVRSLAPAYLAGDPPPMGRAFLDWGKIRILPEALFRRAGTSAAPESATRPTLPPVEGDDHYGYARETDSALVETAAPAGQDHQYEKFLFYRGVGNFKLPLRFVAQGEGRFAVFNYGPDPIAALFLVHVEGDRIWFSRSQMAGNGVAYLQQTSAPSKIDELGTAMIDALVASGLYEKEARAMVKTWESSWFSEPGTRLLYLLPERLTNVILPLTVEPQPDKMVRVMVGRMEILAPEQAEQLTAALRAAGTCATSHAEPVQGELAKLGRFAEPALKYLARDNADPSLQDVMHAVLAELRVGKDGTTEQ